MRHYFEQWDFYRHIPEMAAQEPYVYRLSLATDTAELIGMLFKGAGTAAQEPGRSTAAG